MSLSSPLLYEEVGESSIPKKSLVGIVGAFVLLFIFFCNTAKVDYPESGVRPSSNLRSLDDLIE